ncbi:MAG: hypothetical protein AB1416_12055, partial [Actinomycetota bacterium]
TVASRVATRLRSGPAGARLALPPALVGTGSSVIAGRFPSGRAGELIRYAGCLAARGAPGGKRSNAVSEPECRIETFASLFAGNLFSKLVGRRLEIRVVGEGTVSGAPLPSPCSDDCSYFLPTRTGNVALVLEGRPAPGWKLASVEYKADEDDLVAQDFIAGVEFPRGGPFRYTLFPSGDNVAVLRFNFVREDAPAPPPATPPAIAPSLTLTPFSANEVLARVRVRLLVNHVRLTFPGRTITAHLPLPGTTCQAAGDTLTCNGSVPAGTDVTANVRLDPPPVPGNTPSQVFASADGGATGETAQGTGP